MLWNGIEPIIKGEGKKNQRVIGEEGENVWRGNREPDRTLE
jgi:hypothetical protein